ncbi:hypothetical protein [Leadbetterella sp. DM7]|uniref:hypothetical protein n=1 Tax=Leadbetterella sp. DM7 TaxID=3235085 RepID=UPI00349EB72A
MKYAFKQLVFILLLIPFSCKDKTVDPEAPAVVTGDMFSISGRGTVITGTVTSEGGYKLSEIGVVYGTSSAPTIEDVKEAIDMTEVSDYPHEYAVTIRGGLPSGTVYYRAYVMANGKPFYGETKRKG